MKHAWLGDLEATPRIPRKLSLGLRVAMHAILCAGTGDVGGCAATEDEEACAATGDVASESQRRASDTAEFRCGGLRSVLPARPFEEPLVADIAVLAWASGATNRIAMLNGELLGVATGVKNSLTPGVVGDRVRQLRAAGVLESGD